MHLAPDGEEGYNYSAEQVYEMLLNPIPSNKKKGHWGNSNMARPVKGGKGTYRDDHSLWAEESDPELRETWTARVVQAARAVEVRDPSNSRGMIPAFAQRILKELTDPRIDWRLILNEFIQPEIND